MHVVSMSKTLSDFSQLSRAMFRRDECPAEAKPAAKVEPRDDGEDVLAYFSRSSGGKPNASAVVRSAAKETEKSAATEVVRENPEVAELRREVARLQLQLKESAAERTRETKRLQAECERLNGELRHLLERTAEMESRNSEAEVRESAPVEEVPDRKPGILEMPASFAEAFPGEVREMVVAALSDALEGARRGSRERRATVLEAVLAANRSMGELERRRAELRQILKDAGYYTDPRALASLGFRLISGRVHWKLVYANVRITIAKTPSDYRSALNSSADMANRCF